MRTNPDWLVAEPYTEVDLGTLRTGKEAQVDVVERTDADGHTCLLARKRYLPRTVTAKGTLEALGVQRASTFHNDVEYREGRQFRKSRDRRAVEAMTTYGKRLLQDRWTGHEYDVMARLWDAGVSVPYPVAYADDLFYLEYIGAPTAPRRSWPGPASTGAELDDGVATSCVDALHGMMRRGHRPRRPLAPSTCCGGRAASSSSTCPRPSTSPPTRRASTSSTATC